MTKTATLVKPKQFVASAPIRRKMNVRNGVGKVSKTFVTVIHKEDPKEALLARLGTLPSEVVQLTRILVAVYQPPVITKLDSGIMLPNAISEEDVEEYLWQGKVGLIVAMGPQAYEDDDHVKFHGTKNKVGDWVWFQPSNGMACEVNEVFCRVLREKDIIGTIPHPDAIW